jgi:DNA-binding NarL/FixJ family response regulator
MTSQLRRAVLADPLPLWLEAVAGIVAGAGVEVAGKASSVASTLRLLDRLQPDLLVMDTELGSGADDGLECLRQAHARHRLLRSIVLSARSHAADVSAALAAGASAYVVKNAHPEDLSTAIRQAFDVSLYFQHDDASSAPAPAPGAAAELTPREIEILALAAKGDSNATIAQRLWVTEQTVKFHLSNIYRKLQVSNRTEAARWAHLNGLMVERRPDLHVA